MNHLEFRNVSVAFGHGPRRFVAVDDVSLSVPAGKIVGLVGESGSGKSTLARAAVGLCEPSAGSVLLDGVQVSHARGANARLRQRIQMIFQDPSSCLNPKLTIGQSVAEALDAAAKRAGTRTGRAQRAAETARLLESVQLPAARAADLPAALSGGQRQRVALARALAAAPGVILADEITSALDVSVQGSVLNLLRHIQRELGLGILFVSHNLAVVRYLCDEVAVMQSGRLVEHGETMTVLDHPRQDYTKTLLQAVPRIGEPLFAPATGMIQISEGAR
ncbi:ABC transporter ATP-binding protein [Specibacter cremeus]|uniref:ABC transporter ATP-binding protein n=1 Tax=Specibacter cremeus TaxID=1629051 RepID=UPI000F76AEC1|nr:ATP-binding cassette domain-containing protein [Specibacter cremeus]